MFVLADLKFPTLSRRAPYGIGMPFSNQNEALTIVASTIVETLSVYHALPKNSSLPSLITTFPSLLCYWRTEATALFMTSSPRAFQHAPRNKPGEEYVV